MRPISDTIWITESAKALGFDLCGVAAATRFPEMGQTEVWLAKGYAGEMKYLGDPRRNDPQSVLHGVRSVIVCALNYNTPHPKSTDRPKEPHTGEPHGWISRYAWGDDYHDVLRRKLSGLVVALKERFDEPFETLAYADTGPLQERIFAKHAGLGWLGKNTLLLNQALGSWFFLGAILTTLDLTSLARSAAESPPPDLCGSCTRCIDACPTDALVEPYVLDARRCISYLTIELRGSVPEALREPIGRHVFGCDICQDVCPWNRRAPVTQAGTFQPRTFALPKRAVESDEAESGSVPSDGIALSTTQSLLLPSLEWMAAMTEDDYKVAFRNSAIKRAKWRGMVRNACIALGNAKLMRGTRAGDRVSALLQRLAASPDPPISESALWALCRIQ